MASNIGNVINHIANGHILTLFGSSRDRLVTVAIETEAGSPLIFVQGLAVSLKPVILFFEQTALVLAQRDAQLISDGNERIGCAPNQPGAPQIEPYAGRDFFRVRASADAVGSLDHRVRTIP